MANLLSSNIPVVSFLEVLSENRPKRYRGFYFSAGGFPPCEHTSWRVYNS